MRLWWWFLLAGCKFQIGAGGDAGVGDDAAIDAAPDGAIDAAIDAGPVSCLDRWIANTIRFSAPVALTTVNSSGFDRDPYLLPDERTLYVSSARPGSTGSDTWIATRATTGDPFNTPTIAAGFSTAGNETKVAITANGLYAVLGTDQAGGAGAVDVWEASRTSTAMNFGALTRTHLMLVNTASSDHDPTISADGLRLYLAPSSPGAQHISVASRATVSDNFGAALPITEINSASGEGDPSPSADDRIIVFSSNRAGSGAGGSNVYYATRATASGTFSAPRPVPDINTDFSEGDPHLSTDGCRLYFGRDVGATSWDIFVATAQ